MTTATALRDERLALVERLEGLSDDEWGRPSLCAGWSVHDVVAHLATPLLVSAPVMATRVLRTRSIARAMDATARQLARERDPQELLGVLRSGAASTVRPPGLPLAAPLTDAVAHSADVRWALGDPVADWGRSQRLGEVLDFLTGPRALVAFVPPRRLSGLRLVADDLDRTWGRGAEVRGPAVVVALAVLGRAAALPALHGEGVARLAP